MAKSPRKASAKGPVVLVKDWVLVKMPAEEGKPADRYFVVEVEASVAVETGRIIEEGSRLAYARKRLAIEVTKYAEARQRSPQVVE